MRKMHVLNYRSCLARLAKPLLSDRISISIFSGLCSVRDIDDFLILSSTLLWLMVAIFRRIIEWHTVHYIFTFHDFNS